MLIKEVMSKSVITVRESTTVKQALAILDKEAITAVPVVGSHRRIVGIVSEADLIRDAVQHDVRRHVSHALEDLTVLPPHEVGEVMSRHPITVHPEADLVDAVELMTSTGVKSLPVVDDRDEVVGMISRRDIVRVLARPDTVLEAEADDLFRHLGFEWEVEVRDGVATVSGPPAHSAAAVASTVAGAVPGIVGVTVDED